MFATLLSPYVTRKLVIVNVVSIILIDCIGPEELVYDVIGILQGLHMLVALILAKV